jgi:membrane protein DedA with SNARE-associated domain
MPPPPDREMMSVTGIRKARTMFDLLGHNPTALLAVYGYWAVLALVTVESMGIPVPGEATLLAAAIYAGTTHRLSIVLVVLAAATGAITGDNIGFLIGRTGGARLLQRVGRYVRLNEGKLQLGRYLFDRHDGKVVFFGRFVAVLRVWAAVLAGANQMPWKRFLAFNTAGGVLWATLMGSLAFALGDHVHELNGPLSLGSTALAATVMLGGMIAMHRVERRWQREMRPTEMGCDALAA